MSAFVDYRALFGEDIKSLPTKLVTGYAARRRDGVPLENLVAEAKPVFSVINALPTPSSGFLHAGHLIGNIISDVSARRAYAQGQDVLAPNRNVHDTGWDTHRIAREIAKPSRDDIAEEAKALQTRWHSRYQELRDTYQLTDRNVTALVNASLPLITADFERQSLTLDTNGKGTPHRKNNALLLSPAYLGAEYRYTNDPVESKLLEQRLTDAINTAPQLNRLRSKLSSHGLNLRDVYEALLAAGEQTTREIQDFKRKYGISSEELASLQDSPLQKIRGPAFSHLFGKIKRWRRDALGFTDNEADYCLEPNGDKYKGDRLISADERRARRVSRTIQHKYDQQLGLFSFVGSGGQFAMSDHLYERFMHWQFRKLDANGVVMPVLGERSYCTSCGSTKIVSDDHSEARFDGRASDISIVRGTIIHFVDPQTERIYPAFTTSADTLPGVTHVSYNSQSNYVVCKFTDGEREFVLAKEMIEQIETYTGRRIQQLNAIKGNQFNGIVVKNPLNEEMVPLISSSFVRSSTGTGFVMGVPKHDPHDLVALLESNHEDLVRNARSVLVDKDTRAPLDIVVDMDHYKSLHPVKREQYLERIREEAYRLQEARGVIASGIMAFSEVDLAGKTPAEAREWISNALSRRRPHLARPLSYHSRAVRCRVHGRQLGVRSGYEPAVNYELNWLQDKAVTMVGSCLITVPATYKRQTISVRETRPTLAEDVLLGIDQVDDEQRIIYHAPGALETRRARPCIRRADGTQGSGYPFKTADMGQYVIDALSDSNMYWYWSFFKDLLDNNVLQQEHIRDELFDYLFTNRRNGSYKHNPDHAQRTAAAIGLEQEVLEGVQVAFDTTFPLGMNIFATEHAHEHGAYSLYFHAAIAPHLCPKTYVMHKLMTRNGEKMSKSLGNTISAQEVYDTSLGLVSASFSANDKLTLTDDEQKLLAGDLARFYLAYTMQFDADIDWRDDDFKSISTKRVFGLMNRIYELAQTGTLSAAPRTDASLDDTVEDQWLESRQHQSLKDATAAANSHDLKTWAKIVADYMRSDLNDYVNKGGNNPVALRNYIATQLQLLHPIAPMATRILYRKLQDAGVPLADEATVFGQGSWPQYDDGKARLDPEVAAKFNLRTSTEVGDYVARIKAGIRGNAQTAYGRLYARYGEKDNVTLEAVLRVPTQYEANLLSLGRDFGEAGTVAALDISTIKVPGKSNRLTVTYEVDPSVQVPTVVFTSSRGTHEGRLIAQ